MPIFAEIAPGELFDKITILEIKRDKMTDPKKLGNVDREHKILVGIRDEHISLSGELRQLVADLKTVNEKLWGIEDDIRECERRKDFGESFIVLARSVYIHNDDRALLKRKINTLLHSSIFEEKSYQAY